MNQEIDARSHRLPVASSHFPGKVPRKRLISYNLPPWADSLAPIHPACRSGGRPARALDFPFLEARRVGFPMTSFHEVNVNPGATNLRPTWDLFSRSKHYAWGNKLEAASGRQPKSRRNPLISCNVPRYPALRSRDIEPGPAATLTDVLPVKARRNSLISCNLFLRTESQICAIKLEAGWDLFSRSELGIRTVGSVRPSFLSRYPKHCPVAHLTRVRIMFLHPGHLFSTTTRRFGNGPLGVPCESVRPLLHPSAPSLVECSFHPRKDYVSTSGPFILQLIRPQRNRAQSGRCGYY